MSQERDENEFERADRLLTEAIEVLDKLGLDVAGTHATFARDLLKAACEGCLGATG